MVHFLIWAHFLHLSSAPLIHLGMANIKELNMVIHSIYSTRDKVIIRARVNAGESLTRQPNMENTRQDRVTPPFEWNFRALSYSFMEEGGFTWSYVVPSQYRTSWYMILWLLGHSAMYGIFIIQLLIVMYFNAKALKVDLSG